MLVSIPKFEFLQLNSRRAVNGVKSNAQGVTGIN
jgi:hypothetical protein